jgi:hypothetical protein
MYENGGSGKSVTENRDSILWSEVQQAFSKKPAMPVRQEPEI